MALALRTATIADAAALADIYLTAFAASKDAISLLVFPRNDSSRKFWTSMIEEEIPDPNAHHIVVYSTTDPDQSPIAFAKWNTSAAELPSEMPTWPEGGDSALGDHFFGELMKSHRAIMGDKKHWYLELVATRPEWQGRGAAGKLLRWGMERAGEEEMECYLEASPEGKPVYEHLGFGEVGRLVVSLEGKGEVVGDEKEFVEVFMVRPVMGKASNGG